MENKNINGKVQRGEIYLYDFGNNGGSIQNGVRPALVVRVMRVMRQAAQR